MRDIRLYRAVRPYLSAVAVIATSAVLVFTIYFTEIGLQWTTFLTGLLVASILAEASRMSRSEWILMRRTAQLASMKDKLEHMTRLHEQDEKGLAVAKSRLRLMDETMPTMVALIDSDGRCRYHNRAFRNWLQLRPEQINDRYMREILGSKVYTELATVVRQSLDGQAASYVRTHTMPNGAVYRLAVEHVPQLDERGKVTGFYMLANDLTERDDVPGAARHASTGMGAAPDVAGSAAAQTGQADQDLFIASLSEQVTGQEDAGRRIFSAIEGGEFSLFCQLIAPLETGSGESAHYEILIRLKEEEQNMMPPGAFFPLAEKHGLMPYLDRWVVQHILQRVTIQNQQGIQQQGSIFFINVARATIRDPEFPAFLAMVLQEYGVAGSVLCFEVPDSELILESAVVAEFIQQVRQCGCHVALSGFGRDGVSFNLIRGFQVEFLKIDGSIVLEILRDPVGLAKVVAISRVAKKIGIKTIAEMVESEEAITKLREAGVDFAQGFGISRPNSFIE
ncbi:MAG: EAL domain-containing protein [Gallionellaceae bacterium]|nr:EAL domain-containing protein [Gallionellaceae bacterium]